MQNGKGDKDRVRNKRAFRDGYDKIKWPSKDKPKCPTKELLLSQGRKGCAG